MKTKLDIQHILDTIQSKKTIEFDRQEIERTYSTNTTHLQTVPIKILSICGGLLASTTFFGFLAISGLYNSKEALLSFGTLSILIGIWLSRRYTSMLLDTLGISTFNSGFTLLAFGLSAYNIHEQYISLLFALFSLGCLSMAKNYMLSLVSVLLFNGSIMAFIQSTHQNDLLHLYTCLLIIGICYLFSKEAQLINCTKNSYQKYNAIRTALVFSFLIGIGFFQKNTPFALSPQYIWITSACCILAIIYLAKSILPKLGITKAADKISVYCGILITLAPTVLSPSIAGGILLLLLSFATNYRIGFVLSILFLFYFVGQFYYDLNFTLLTKSILLFTSGTFFLILYLYITKRINQNEKI